MQCSFTIPIYIFQRKEIITSTLRFPHGKFATKVTFSVGNYFDGELFRGNFSTGKYYWVRYRICIANNRWNGVYARSYLILHIRRKVKLIGKLRLVIPTSNVKMPSGPIFK
jgi:hypothetical protein